MLRPSHDSCCRAVVGYHVQSSARGPIKTPRLCRGRPEWRLIERPPVGAEVPGAWACGAHVERMAMNRREGLGAGWGVIAAEAEEREPPIH